MYILSPLTSYCEIVIELHGGSFLFSLHNFNVSVSYFIVSRKLIIKLFKFKLTEKPLI
jgi:hypothetical protein